MPEPFKNLYNLQLIEGMANALSGVSDFNSDAFVLHASTGLDDLEMMARAEQISVALEKGLSGDFLGNLRTLIASLHPTKTSELSDMQTDSAGIAGWAVVPMASYLARNGMAFPKESLAGLREMTMRFSTEFAIRYFVRDHPDLAISTALEWASDENFHVRRLSSEGLRPLLPWGIKLHQFVADPSPLIPILERLRDDPSDYVRKSVANNLNDISKNHPDLVASIAKDWLIDASPNRRKLVKHACRSLIKAGQPNTLEAFGYGPPALSGIDLRIPDHVALGDVMPIEFGFKSDKSQSLLIDYSVHFMRASGKLSPKVFKWTEVTMDVGQERTLVKNHPYKRVTTRKDYSGLQILSVQVNGVEVVRRPFEFET